MDPNEARQRIMRAALELHIAQGLGSQEAAIAAAEELVEAWNGLDGWLTGGGFPPDAWAKPTSP